MKIKCFWIYQDGERKPHWKVKDASNMSGEEIINMLTTLLAQNETLCVSFEKGEIKKNDR